MRTPLPHRVDFAKKIQNKKQSQTDPKTDSLKQSTLKRQLKKKQKQTQPKTRKTGRLKKESKTDSKKNQKRIAKKKRACSKLQQNATKLEQKEGIRTNMGDINNFAQFCCIVFYFAAVCCRCVFFCDFFDSFLILF